ncbi:undecaprenyldiphospho-muramoylpentapeptide beta-N-acetylglucosaminyltransferase [Patescibacteria group bacterium]|nr:undecaprenyldiphospho-muramoylpentapeptide beta-N-acetylglucosaminyltransferase [Patescibacteria group bacterium]MBU4580061.1 undecaprenyldiphospho-muramoylpentapeptide beta-N-acetylglucosaminyltransferase [Patescibacteria group bacterium]
MRVLFTGGGTGGHIMPIIAVAEKVKEILNASGGIPNFLFIGSESPFNEVVANFGIPIKTIKTYKLRRYWSADNFADLVNLPIGIIQSFFYVYSFMPDVVFSKGGYASFPVALAAWVFHIPIIIHESDSVAGLANTIEGKMANKVAVSFTDAGNYFAKKKIIFTGNPVRREIFQGNKDRAIEEFGLKRDLPVILILGGSQGSQKINNIVLEAIVKIVTKVQVIHQCGVGNYKDVKQTIIDFGLANIENYHLYPFLLNNLNDAYAVSDLVISRAGANNIAEIINLNKPAILVPLLNSASGHQLKNAYYYSSKGAALLLDETNLTPNMLYDAIFGILNNKSKQTQMIRAARQLMSPNAAQLIADEVIKLGK